MVALFTKEKKEDNKLQVLPMRLLEILGFFVPLMREMPEMMYQYSRDYFLDSSKFDRGFHFRTTSFQQGVKETFTLAKLK